MIRSIQKLMRLGAALLMFGAVAGAAELPTAPGAFSGCEVVDYKEEGNSGATPGSVHLLATSPNDVVKTEKWIVKSPSAPKVRYVVKQSLLASGQVELCSYTPNRVLATLNAGENETAFRAAMAAKGLTVKYELMKDSKGNSVFVVEAEDTENDVVETMTASIQSTGYCGEKIYRNTIYSICATPNDPYWSQQWNMVKIGAPEAWDATTDASSVTVAVLDTGINYNHLDLNENLWTNPGEFSKGSNGVDDDGNGIVDDLYGMQCIGGNISGNPIDDVYHGSHCAGIIGAVGNNMFGVAGVAWSAKIMALKFCDASGNGSLEDVIRCLNYADEKGARIVNCSWIVEGQWDDLLAERIKSLGNKGVIFVCAAGNANKGESAVDLDNEGPPTYPACFTCSNIISVAATDSNDELASFSFWGERSVDIAAPGVNIYSTELGGMGIKLDSGTSMATPHVVGALALLMAYYPSESPYALVQKLYDCAEPIPSLKGKVKTGKRLSLKGLFGLRAPTGAEVTASLGTSSEAVIIYWNAVAGATHYRVYRAESENGEKTLLRDWHVGLTFNDTTAVPEQRYYYFIQAASSDAGASASPFSPGVIGYRASAPTTVKVTFNAAGGSVTPTSATFKLGEKYGELPTPTYTGKIFLGWHTGTTDGTRIDATCVVRKDVTTLHAHWIGSSEPRLENLFASQRYPWNGYVDVSFTLAGIESDYVGDVALRAINDNGTSTSLSSWVGNAPTNLPNGAHKFVWNSLSDVGSTLSTNIALAATLTTRLATVKSTITLDKQGGTGGTSSVTATNGLAMPPITIPSRTGYTFGGYYTQTGGSGTQYYTSTGASARTWDKTSATTLYAKWTANTYTIRFNANGGSGTMSDITMKYDVARYLPTNTFTMASYKFTGWATSAGGTVVYAPNASVQNLTSTNGAIVTLYAVWQPQVSTLADAVDNATLTITTGGGANWTVDATSAYTGTASAKSGAIGDGQSSWMQTTITGPGTFSFRWKVSCESSYDTLTWTLDGAEQSEISGSTSWIEETKEVTAGTHTIRWNYAKDESGSEGSDAAWVDAVVTPLLPPANVTASDGTSTANVKVTWTATVGATNYAVWRSETNSSSAATKLGTVAATSYTDTTALPGKIYYYFVTATDGTRTSLFGTSNSGYRALTAPSNVVASDNSLSLGVRITWDAVDGADGYAIYRGTSTSSSTATQIATSMGTAYIDGEVASATTAYYFVKAQRGTVSSAFSAYDKGTRKSGEPLYIAIDVASGTISELSSVPSGGWTDEYKTTKLVLRRIANGSFTMGSPAGEVGRYSYEDQHQVTLSKPFYIGVFEVTQKQYELVMGSNPSYYKGDMRPVECVSYNMIRGTSLGAQWPTTNTVDATSFMGKIRAKTGLTFDLPTEAQWEYACRAGTTTALNSGKNLTSETSDSNMDEVGCYNYNYSVNKGGYTYAHKNVGSYKPNAWGLYDMHGNVWEWCLDWYASSLGTSSVTNPKGASSGSNRVFRGGGWCDYARYCRSADRDNRYPSSTFNYVGFRLSCATGQQGSQATITFNANGGSGTMSSVQTGIGGSFAIPQVTFTRTGYAFQGWATSSSGSVVYEDKATIANVTAGQTLYAKWALIVPNAPTNVSATDGTNTSGVKVTWSSVSGATRYDIYRGTSSSSSSATLIGTTTGTTYTDTTPQSGTTYYYWVKAYRSDNGQYSSFSSYDTGYWTIPTPSVSSTYIVIDLAGGANTNRYAVSELSSVPSGGWTDEYKTTKLVLRRIANGSFTMGSPAGEVGRYSNEDQHQVTLSKPFYIGVFEVTQKQYELVMGSNPSYYKGDMRPVEWVSYNTIRGTSLGAQWPTTNTVDATSFMGKIRAKTGLTFDLPTEAQWEYACRAGTTTALNSGKNLTSLYQDTAMDEVGRYGYDSGYYTGIHDGKGGYAEYHTTVGSYKPNNWGLYDMHGNVWEWCLDWYTSSLGTSSVTNPRGASSGSRRVGRGGGWYSLAQFCRSAYRNYHNPSYTYIYIGFRLSMTLP